MGTTKGCVNTSACLGNTSPAQTCAVIRLWRAWSMRWVGSPGVKPWCVAAADVLTARATSYKRPWSLMFSWQWLLQALGPAKTCAISLKLLFVTKLSSSIMTAFDLGVSRVAKGYAGVTILNCRKRKNTILKISVVLKPLYPPPT